MFIKILRRTFWSWWDNFSYSIFTSLTAAVNPFFIIMLAAIWAFYTQVQFFTENDSLFLVIIMTCVFAMPFFPTALAGFRLQSQIIDEEASSLFKDYWVSLKKVFWKGLLHSIVYGLAGLILAYSILYYKDFLGHLFPLNYLLIGVSMWFAIVLFMMQSVIVPLLAQEDYKFIDYYSISLVYTMKKIFPLLLVSLFHVFIFIVLTIPTVATGMDEAPLLASFMTMVPILSYFGLAATLHHWTFKYVDGQLDVSDPLPRRKFKELLNPFRFKKSKKMQDEDLEEEEESDKKD